MARPTLSAADSDRFRECLVELRRKNDWSLSSVSRILGCCRKTAWTHLQPGCEARVKVSYARRLADYSGQEFSWDPKNRLRMGLQGILSAWKEASISPLRRKVAWRLAIYLSEYAVIEHEMVTSVCVVSGLQGNPSHLELVLQNPMSSAYGQLVIHFDAQERDTLALHFGSSESKVTFKGELSSSTFLNIINKIRSWKKKHPPG